VVTKAAAFNAAVVQAAAGARAGHIVTFGIEPDAPETGYGYIHLGASLDGLDGLCCVEGFAEKPDPKTAAAYLTDGGYRWNSGMFVFRADVMLAELDRHAPGIVEGCRSALEKSKRDLDFVRLDIEYFEKLRGISIDYAVMEKTDRAGKT
jgi:mannose-1-phosphate guanylyltransferase